MKIVNALRTILANMFSAIALSLFLIWCCVSDIPSGQIHIYVLTILTSGVFALLAIVIEDYRSVTRHLCASFYTLLLGYGLVFKKKSTHYRNLYKIAYHQNNLSQFYTYILHKYDESVSVSKLGVN